MALTPDQARELQKMLLEIEKLSQKLKKNIDTTSLQDLEKSAGTIKHLFASLSDEWEEMTEDVNFAISGFQKIVQEISNVNIGLRDSNKAYKGLVSLAEDLQSHQYGIRELSSDQIKKLAEQAKLEKQRIENAQELVKERKKEQESDLKRLEREKELKKLRVEELQNLKTRTEDQEKALKEHKKQLEDLNSQYEKGNESLKKTTDIFTQNQAILENQDGLYSGLLSALDDEIRKAKNLEKALGLSGAAVDGISKALNKAGLGALADQMGLDEAKAKMKEVAHSVTQGGNKAAGLVGQFKILGAGIGSLGRSIMKNLTDPLIMAGIAAKGVSAGIGLIKKGFSLLSGGVSSVVGFVKNLWGMADQFAAVFEKYAKAGQFAAQNFSAIGSQVNAITSGLNAAAAADPFMRVAEAGPALKAIVDGTGMMQSQMTKSVKEAHDLSYWLGYSAEETGQLYKLGQLNGETAKDVVADIRAQGLLLNKQYKTSLDLRKVEQVAAKASAAVKFNLSQNPKALADAAFHATKLSMTLDEIAAASEQTLNFEQSIQDQLAYQAMSGKEINIDAYQQAALRGDSATAAKELNNLIAQHGPGLKNNVLLQEQFAKSIGISKDKLLEAMTTQDLANKMGEDRVDIEKGLQYYMKQGLTREEAANKLAKEGLATQLAQSKRAEAMSRALEDFRDYMATKLWPLFKAVFSPANIKMFMAVISGMRPVFEELGRAITAFFSPKSAGAMTDVIKNDVMPAILDLAKMVTEVAGVLGESLFGVIKTLGPVIKKDVVPIFKFLGGIIKELAPTVGTLVQSFAQGLAKVFSKINEHKEDIKSFIEILAKGLTNVFSFVADHLKAIAITLVAFKALTAVRSLKNAIMGSPGSSSMNPMYVKNVGVPGGGGAAAGGGIMDKIKGFFGKGGKAVGAAGATAGATSGITGAASAGAKGAAGAAGAAGGAAPSAGAGMAGASKFGNMAGGMLKGAAAILVLSGALYVAAKAFQEFGKVKWEAVSKGITVLGGLTIAALALSKVKGKIIEGALAIGILGASLYPAAKAFQEFASVKWEDMGKAAAALTGLGIAAYFLGKALPEIGMGALAIAALGASLFPLAAALNLAEPGLRALGEVFSKVLAGIPPIINAIADGLVRLATEASPGALVALGAGLSALAVGVGALGLAAAGAGMAGAVSSFFGGGGLFTLLEQLIEISKVDFRPAAKSLKEGILEIASIGAGVDLGPFEDMFDDLEDAIEEIDIDDLKKFDELKNINFKDAASSLKEGIASLAELGASFNIGSDYGVFGDVKGALFGESDENSLQAVFKKLEDVFEYLNSAIEEIDVTSFVEFSKLASVNITDAVTSLQQGMASLAGLGESFNIGTDSGLFGDIGGALFGESDEGSLQAVFKKLERVFDLFEDAVAEIDTEQLVNFSKLAGTDISTAVASLQSGMQSLIGLEITDNDIKFDFTALENLFLQLEDVFDVFEDAIAELDFEQLNEFSKLASVNLADAVTSLQSGMQSLVGLKITDSNNVDIQLENLKGVFSQLENIFDVFEDALAELDFDQLTEFSKLASANLGDAAASLQSGMQTLTNLKITDSDNVELSLDTLKTTFSKLEDVFDYVEDALAELDMDQLVNFSKLASANLGEATASLQSGMQVLANLKITDSNNVELSIDTLKNTFSQLEDVFDYLEDAMAELDFDQLTNFSKLASVSLADAASSLQGGMQVLANLKITDSNNIELSLDTIKSNFSLLEDIFDYLEDTIAELDFKQLTDFGSLASVSLSGAATSLRDGIQTLANLKITTGAENTEISLDALKGIFTQLEDVFDYLEDAVAELDIESLNKLASLNLTNLPSIIASIKEFITTAQTITISEDTFENIKNQFESFNDAVSELDIENINSLANLNGDAVLTASEKIVSSIEKLSAIKLSGDALQTALSDFSDAVAELDIDTLNGLANLNVSNLPNVITSIQEFITRAQTINIPEDTFKNIEAQLEKFSDIISELDIEDLSELAEINGANLTSISTSIKDVIANWNGLSVSDDLVDKLDLFNEAVSQLDVEGLNEFTTLNGSNLLTVSTSIKDAINAWVGLVVGEDLPTSLKNFNNGINALNVEKLKSLNEVNTSNLQVNFANIKTSVEQFKDMADITSAIKLINAFHKVLDIFFKADYSKSTVISTIQELTKIDTTKLDTLKKSIDSLSISFKEFGSTITGMGDLTPVITVSTKMLELHQSLTKNPINEKAVKQLTEGVKAIFSSLMLGVIDFLVKNPNAINMNKAFGSNTGNTTTTPVQDGVVHAKDGELNPNGGPVVSTFQKGQLVPVMQGIKEDNVYLTTNKPQSAPAGRTVVDNSEVIAAINKLTEIMASSTDKKIVVDVKSDIPAFVSKVRQTSFGG